MRDFHGLLINSRDNLALTAVVAELAQVDALPCAEVETTVGDWDGYADAKERALGMRRHVISSFHGVIVVWLPFFDHMV